MRFSGRCREQCTWSSTCAICTNWDRLVELEGCKKCPAPILHQVKERPCKEHLAWRWNGNWNMAQATKNVWKLQPWMFRWLWKGCACDQNYPKQTKHSAIQWLDGYTFTLNQLLDEQPSNATEIVSFLISRARGLLRWNYLKLICEITSREPATSAKHQRQTPWCQAQIGT